MKNNSSDISVDPEAGSASFTQLAESPELVDFDTPSDPANPLRWSSLKKFTIVMNIALLSATGQKSSSMVAPSVTQITKNFETTNTVLAVLAVLVVSVFFIGTTAGLLLTSGLSEVYGRVAVVHVTNVLFVAFSCAAAVSQSLGQLLGFRFLQGVAAAAPPTIGGGVIGDMFEPKDRGRAISIYGLGMLLGPMAEPIAGGYAGGGTAGSLQQSGLAVIFGMMFLMLSTRSTVYQDVYRWSTGSSGLPYLGLEIGLFIGLGIYIITADEIYRTMCKAKTPTPEMRLAPITLGSPLCAIGLIMYGWAFEADLHWILPIVGCIVFCLGMVAFIMPVTTYLIDAFHANAAGPVGAASVLRCLAGGLLPLCTDNMYTDLGFGWGNTTLAFIALAFAPFPYLLYRNGERLRQRFPINE